MNLRETAKRILSGEIRVSCTMHETNTLRSYVECDEDAIRELIKSKGLDVDDTTERSVSKRVSKS